MAETQDSVTAYQGVSNGIRYHRLTEAVSMDNRRLEITARLKQERSRSALRDLIEEPGQSLRTP